MLYFIRQGDVFALIEHLAPVNGFDAITCAPLITSSQFTGSGISFEYVLENTLLMYTRS